MDTQCKNDDFEVLITRASKYEKNVSDTTATASSTRTTHRGKNIFLCREHYNAIGTWTWSAASSDCNSCIKYETRKAFGNGTLPTGNEVMEYLLTLRTENNGLHVNSVGICSTDFALHWIYCTVYPYTLRGIEQSIKKMDDNYKQLKKSSSRKKLSETN